MVDPDLTLSQRSTDTHLVQRMFVPALPTRSVDAHKGSFGSVAILGGDTGMAGAVLLAARAALFCGAGRIYAQFLADDAPKIDLFHPEIMLRSAVNSSLLATFIELTHLNCLVVGPGLGQSNTAFDWLKLCIDQDLGLLMDADALNLISQHQILGDLLKNRQAESIITPHPAEAARLLKCSIEHIQQNRVESAQKLAYQFNATCVLKGAGTIIASPDGAWAINTTGNPGLASGGTGDVLSGIIGSLVAQGLSGLQAAKLGVYVHGGAADSLVARGFGPVGLTASEIALEARNQINLLNQLGH